MSHSAAVAGFERPFSYESGMWRVDVGDVHYCSETKEGLMRALSSQHHASIRKPDVFVPEEDPAMQYIVALTNAKAHLPERQEARRHLMQLVLAGNELASAAVEKLNEKEPSRQAREITRRLGKQDFSDVTYVELTEHIENIVTRNRLITELSERVSL